MTFTRDLLRRHATSAVDRTTFEEVPVGWHALLSDLFEGIAPLLSVAPGGRLHVRQIEESLGGLLFRWTLDAIPAGVDANSSDAIRHLVATAEATYLRVWDRCGRPGLPHFDAGFYATRCDEHAPPGSEPADEIESGDGSPISEPMAEAPRPEEDHAAVPPNAVPADAGSGSARSRGRERSSPWSMELYGLDAVAAALGQRRVPAALADDDFAGDPDELAEAVETSAGRAPDNEHQARLQEILDAGSHGRWRDLAAVPAGALDALDDLGRRAPHLGAVTDLVRRHLRASVAIGLPVALPPLLLLGEPGVGKTWYLSRLAAALELPFRVYPMNVSTLGEGLSGAHPSWRNSGPGLVARTLLRERVGNPVIFVDEVDKGQSNGWSRDPYAPLYSLLDRANAEAFVDEYLQFPIDASAVLWVLAGNTAHALPDPIVDRLTVIPVPAMSASQIAAVCGSIYAEANAARRDFFDPEPGEGVVAMLLDLSPRSIRIVLEDAMVTAAASGRRTLTADDLRPRGGRVAYRMGFRA